MDTGLILVTTGDEAHHSIPAMGQAFRAIGHKMKLCIIEFVSGVWSDWLHKLPDGFRDLAEIHELRCHLDPNEENPRKSWDKAKELIHSGRFQMVVMEGLSSLIDRRIVDPGEIADCLATRPKCLHVIIADVALNGPILDVVDLVTDMKRLKNGADGSL
jgi:cob(I)alamin adenosyltransferase